MKVAWWLVCSSLATGCAVILGGEGGILDERAIAGDGGVEASDASTTTDSEIPGEGGRDSAVPAEGGCGGLHGPTMARVAGGGCIDTTEVTKAQYEEFRATLPTVKTDGPCAFNTTYLPIGYVDVATTNPQQAVAGIDWCDARDYCAWAGKRLCGKRSGGALGFAEHNTATSEWYLACSQGVDRKHPYGTTADDTAKAGFCHLDQTDQAPGKQSVVKAFPNCVLPDAGVYDLLGNVEEWIDSCETVGLDGGLPRCRAMGGIWFFASSYSDCKFSEAAPRDSQSKVIGIRCCGD